MSPPNAVLDVDVHGTIWVFHRNEHGAYEYVFGSILFTVYKVKRLWVASIKFRSSNPTEAWKQESDGVTAVDAVYACLSDALPRILMMQRHCEDFSAFTKARL